jgi:lysozyme family protein
MTEFLLVLSIIFQIEGGWTEIDGGTNYGIRAATLARANDLKIVRARNIRQLTRREAAVIYYRMYWLESGAYKYSYPINLVMFDAAVHMGPGEAKEIMRTVKKKYSSLPPRRMATQFVLERYKQLRGLSNFSRYKRGWQKRIYIIARYVHASEKRRALRKTGS